MPEYVVMFPADNEAEWMAGTPADHQATLGTDEEFIRRLTGRGGGVKGGAALADSQMARTIRRGPGSTSRTDGPFAETVEQLSGFYIVTCEDYDALAEAAEVLLRAHPIVEIRPVEEF